MQRTDRVLQEETAMAQVLDRGTLDPNGRMVREKAVKILAKSIYRELKSNGYEAREIVALSTELLGLLTTEIKPESDVSAK
jgi:hypothetical protein